MNLEHFAASLEQTASVLRSHTTAVVKTYNESGLAGEISDVTLEPSYTAIFLCEAVAIAIRAGLDPDWKAPPNG